MLILQGTLRAATTLAGGDARTARRVERLEVARLRRGEVEVFAFDVALVGRRKVLAAGAEQCRQQQGGKARRKYWAHVGLPSRIGVGGASS